jgi:porin
VQIKKNQVRKSLILAVFLLLASAMGNAQSAEDAPKTVAPAASESSIEDLNWRGGDAAMPPFTDSSVDVNSSFRRTLLSKGMALRFISQEQFAQDLLQAPVPADQQAFVGEHPFEGAMLHSIFTADLRQLGLHHAQFNLSGAWNWVSWESAGIKAFDLFSLYLYKEFGKDRVEVKTGYNSNELEYVGMQVGGSTATGAQGVYAVLPYEVGMAYFPMSAPQFNLKLNGPAHTYVKTGVQRSYDPKGGPANEARNHSGLRFDPKGDKALVLSEAGYRRAPSATERETWFRAGYLRNSTLYTDKANGKQEAGNHAAFALVDVQLTRPDPLKPWQGLYLGGSAMTAASKFNPYDRYYEARLYKFAPFPKRQGDVASLLSTYTGHSKYFTDPLVAAGKTVWRNSASMTGSYNIHLAPGNYLSLGLSYIRGAAITPRVDDTLTFAASYSVFF